MGLIRHRKLPIVFVSVGEGDGEDIIARSELRAVGRGERLAVDRGSRVGFHFHGHRADVLGEDNAERVAADGGLDGVAAGGALDCLFLNINVAITIYQTCTFNTVPSR